MKESYTDYAGFVPQEQSDVMIRMKVLAGELYKLRCYTDYLQRQMFPSTAIARYLDLHAEERGLTRKAAAKASGTVYFYPTEETHDAIRIPAGTIVCSVPDMLRFTTDAEVVLEADSEKALAHITAVEGGKQYNVKGGTVTMIVTPIAGIGRVYNGSLIRGGADAESDEELRARVIDSYQNISNGTNAAYYRRIAMSVSGVESASVVGRARGAGTVNVYVLGPGGEDVTNDKLTEVLRLLRQERELNVDVGVYRPHPIEVTFYIRLRVEPGYSFDAVSAEVQTAVTDHINSLGIGQDVLMSDIGELIYHIKGVADYKFLESYGSDRSISDSQYAWTENIVVSEV